MNKQPTKSGRQAIWHYHSSSILLFSSIVLNPNKEEMVKTNDMNGKESGLSAMILKFKKEIKGPAQSGLRHTGILAVKRAIVVKIQILVALVISLSLLVKSQAAQDATVVTDGAIVYKTANFDSGVLGYLRAGQQVRISNKTIGAFYRVKFRNRIGYISDVDVKLINPISPSPQDQANNDTDNNNNQTDKPQEPPQKASDASVDNHLARIPYAGIIGSYFLNNNYIAKHVSSINRSGSFTYGLKFNFSSQLFASYQTWDITTHFTLTAPQGYHSNLAIFLEIQLLFFLDAIMKNNGFLFIGLGPTVNRWHLKRDEMSATQAKLNFGGIVSFHLGIHLGSVVLKIEPRYYIGSANSLAILAGLQKVL